MVYDRKIFYEREFVKGKKSGNDKYYWIKINIIGKNWKNYKQKRYDN